MLRPIWDTHASDAKHHDTVLCTLLGKLKQFFSLRSRLWMRFGSGCLWDGLMGSQGRSSWFCPWATCCFCPWATCCSDVGMDTVMYKGLWHRPKAEGGNNGATCLFRTITRVGSLEPSEGSGRYAEFVSVTIIIGWRVGASSQ